MVARGTPRSRGRRRHPAPVGGGRAGRGPLVRRFDASVRGADPALAVVGPRGHAASIAGSAARACHHEGDGGGGGGQDLRTRARDDRRATHRRRPAVGRPRSPGDRRRRTGPATGDTDGVPARPGDRGRSRRDARGGRRGHRAAGRPEAAAADGQRRRGASPGSPSRSSGRSPSSSRSSWSSTCCCPRSPAPASPSTCWGRSTSSGWSSGCCSRSASLAAYAQLTHTVLSPGAPRRFTPVPDQHVEPGGQPRAARRHRPGHGRRLPPADRQRRARAAPPPSAWPPRASARRSCSTPLLVRPAHLDPPHRLQPPLRLRRHRRGDPPRPLRRRRRSSSPGASARRPTGSSGSPATCPSSAPTRVASLVQKVADRLEVLLRDRQLLDPGPGLGGRQLAPRRRLAVGLRLRLRPRRLAGRPAGRLRPGQHPGRHPHHPRAASGVVEGVLIPTLVGLRRARRRWPCSASSPTGSVNFWLPIPVGGVAYLSLRLRPPTAPGAPATGSPRGAETAVRRRPTPGSAPAAA